MTSTQESHAMPLTFHLSFCTQIHNNEACSFCSRETKYKCIKCDRLVCALCAPETAQTLSEAKLYNTYIMGASNHFLRLQKPVPSRDRLKIRNDVIPWCPCMNELMVP